MILALESLTILKFKNKMKVCSDTNFYLSFKPRPNLLTVASQLLDILWPSHFSVSILLNVGTGLKNLNDDEEFSSLYVNSGRRRFTLRKGDTCWLSLIFLTSEDISSLIQHHPPHLCLVQFRQITSFKGNSKLIFWNRQSVTKSIHNLQDSQFVQFLWAWCLKFGTFDLTIWLFGPSHWWYAHLLQNWIKLLLLGHLDKYEVQSWYL